jgi:hypothetical protein
MWHEIKTWANDNQGLLALIALFMAIILPLTSVLVKWPKRFWPKRRPKVVIIAKDLSRREQWRSAFEDYFVKSGTEGDERPMLIRDIDGIKHYPESAWFKLWLVGFYHSGLLLSFNVLYSTHIKAVEDQKNWYYCDSKDEFGIKVFCVAKISYDRIEHVDWKGDEYWPFTHIYCKFDSKDDDPFEEVVYCERIEREGEAPYYREIVKLNDMRNNRIC